MDRLPMLTLQAPFGSLIACGAKFAECRTYAPHYRGRIIIHQGLTPNRVVTVSMELAHFYRRAGFALESFPTSDPTMRRVVLNADALPLGMALGTVELVSVCRYFRLLPDEPPGRDGAIARASRAGEAFVYDGIHLWHVVGDSAAIADDQWLIGKWNGRTRAWNLQRPRLFPEPIPSRGQQGLCPCRDDKLWKAIESIDEVAQALEALASD